MHVLRVLGIIVCWFYVIGLMQQFVMCLVWFFFPSSSLLSLFFFSFWGNVVLSCCKLRVKII
ncbi:hypothetical protein BDV26DRAFT_272418 [Aspergillus bertholletiae]|uniref:Uncharacterized protein n=1 Tax=Aspergillus bertholletiae TaxID=1226010 RepID=A0A5N7AWK7_9EURO|nr:hypothetical protein BDV26DRAFT_272418 [Aspergillus bertholletiae]